MATKSNPVRTLRDSLPIKLIGLIAVAAGIVAAVPAGGEPPRPGSRGFDVNLRAARELGIKVPQSTLLRADRVIE